MYRIKNKRPFTLLEVLVAFLLIVIAAVPLLAPYPYMFKKQKEFLKELEIDRLANVYFVDLLAKILKNEVEPTPNSTGAIQGKIPATYRFGVNEVVIEFNPETAFTFYLAESNEEPDEAN